MNASDPSRPRSLAQLAASRQNGALSRGPVTLEGKKQSRLNAIRHGLFTRVLDPRDTIWGYTEEFDRFVEDLTEFFHAETDYERGQIELLALDHFRLRRILALEDTFFPSPALADVRTSDMPYPTGGYGSPDGHRHALTVIEDIRRMLEEASAIMVDAEDAGKAAGALAPGLRLSARRWRDYIPADLRAKTRGQMPDAEDKVDILTLFLLERAPVPKQDRRQWRDALKQAWSREKSDLCDAEARERGARWLISQHAKKWDQAAAQGQDPIASLATLQGYETRLRRSIERTSKTLFGLKMMRAQWDRSKDALVAAAVKAFNAQERSGSFSKKTRRDAPCADGSKDASASLALREFAAQESVGSFLKKALTVAPGAEAGDGAAFPGAAAAGDMPEAPAAADRRTEPGNTWAPPHGPFAYAGGIVPGEADDAARTG